jgi:hypothetical protein
MKGTDRVSNAAAGVFIHGLVHLVAWRHTTTTLDEPANELPGIKLSKPLTERFLAVSLNYAFFFLLYRSAPSVPNWHGAVHAMWSSLLLCFLVPPRCGFSSHRHRLALVCRPSRRRPHRRPAPPCL